MSVNLANHKAMPKPSLRQRVFSALLFRTQLSLCDDLYDVVNPEPDADVLSDFAAFQATLRQELEQTLGAASRVHTVAVGMSTREAMQSAPRVLERLTERKDPNAKYRAASYVDGYVFLSSTDRDRILLGFDPTTAVKGDPYQLDESLAYNLHEQIHGILDQDRSHWSRPRPEELRAWGEALTELVSTAVGAEIFARMGVLDREPLLLQCFDPPSYEARTVAAAIIVASVAASEGIRGRTLLMEMTGTGTYRGALDMLISHTPAKDNPATASSMAEELLRTFTATPAMVVADAVTAGSLRPAWKLGQQTASDLLAAWSSDQWLSQEARDKVVLAPFAHLDCGRPVDAVAAFQQPHDRLFDAGNNLHLLVSRAEFARNTAEVSELFGLMKAQPASAAVIQMTLAHARERFPVPAQTCHANPPAELS